VGLEALLKHLGAKYDESKVVPATVMKSAEGRDYHLHKLSADSFTNYDPLALTEKFRVLAVDSGSVSLFDTPYWGIGLVKLKARLIEFDPRTKRGTTIKQDSGERFVLFTEDEAGRDGDIVGREFYEKGNYMKREETRFIRDQLKKDWLVDEDLLLIDGALSMQSFYEKEIVKMHANTVGVSKRSGMRINTYSAASYLTLEAVKHNKSAQPWYCYPLVKEYPVAEPIAEMMFASFTPNSRYAFRVDFPFGSGDRNAHIAQQLSKIALFSFDPKYRGYPYPLGAVHTDSVTRPVDKDRARLFVQQKLKDAGLPAGAYDLISKDIENEYWYDRFRSGSNK